MMVPVFCASAKNEIGRSCLLLMAEELLTSITIDWKAFTLHPSTSPTASAARMFYDATRNSYYERLPAAYGGASIFAPGDNGGIAEMVDLKAYVGVYEKGERIPFDDAIPFSLS